MTRPTKKQIVVFALVLTALLVEYGLHSRASVFLEKKIRSEVTKRNIDLEFNKADYGYLPPRLILSDASYKDPSTILTAKRISLSVQVLPLMKGLVKAGSLTIESSNLSHQFSKKKNNSKEPLNLDDFSLEKLLGLIPLEEINILNSKVILLSGEDVVNFDIESGSLIKLYQKIQLELTSIINYRTQNFKNSFYLNTKFRWQDSGFFISFFNLQKENSIAELSGSIDDEVLRLKRIRPKDLYNHVTELRAKLNLDLMEFDDLLVFLTKDQIHPKSSIKNYSGRLQASGYYYKGAETDNTSNVSVKADNLSTPFVSLQSLKTKGELGTDSFSSELLEVGFNDENKLNIENIKIKKNGPSFLISADLKTKKLRIEEVIRALNLRSGGLFAPVAIDAHCGGLFLGKTLIKCEGSGAIQSLNITDPDKGSTIFSVNKVDTKFKTSITSTDLKFSSKNSYKDPETGVVAKGTSSGIVDFIKGFDVEFETDPINLNFVNEVSGQKFSGLTALKGSSQGSSRWGTVSAKLTNTDFKFNELFTGNNTLDFQYKFPNLTFKNIKGELTEGTNFYSGDLKLQVAKKNLNIDLKGNSINDTGVKALFADMFNIPNEVKFDSDFSLQASDGLDLNSMTLDFTTNMKNLSLFGEYFSNGRVHIQGPKGDWAIKEAVLNKDSSFFRASGSLNGLKTIDTEILSSNFDLQESDFLTALNIKITGPANIKLSAKGPLDGPKATGTAVLFNTKSPNKENLGNSNIKYRLFQDYIDFEGAAFNKSIEGKGSYPFEPEKPLAFSGTVKKFNLLDFLNLNAENSSDTKLFVWTKPDLKLQAGQKAKGSLEDTYIELISEGESLAVLKQTEGKKLSEPIKFELLQVSHKANLGLNLSRASHSLYSFEGSLRLDIFKPFIPTCEYIGGVFKSDKLEIRSYQNRVVTKGRGEIQNSKFKTEAFPYSFNKIKSDINLKDNSIMFENIRAAVANTEIKGFGSVALLSEGPYTSFKLNFKRLNVEFPSKITTESSGKLSLTGSKLPLLLSGDMTIHEGLFAQDILSSSNSETVSPNKLLPSKILKKATPPAVLDVNVVIKNKMAIKTNEADGFAYGNLKATGNPADPTLKGLIVLIPGMRINFNDKDFVVNEGTLKYENAVADAPKVFIDASSDVIDTNNPLQTSYAIRTIIKGEGNKQSVKFTSQPALDENQIVSLLTIGTISTESLDQEITTTEQATYSGLQFGSYLVQKNQALKDLQKQTGTQIGLTSSVNSGGVNPTVVVKKSWTPKASSTLSQSFGNQKNLALSNEYKLNEKTSTVFKIQNNQTDDASQLINRRVQQGVILDLGLQYKFEFE